MYYQKNGATPEEIAPFYTHFLFMWGDAKSIAALYGYRANET